MSESTESFEGASASTAIPETDTSEKDVSAAGSSSEPKPTDSYVKLAMRNMVRKRGKSLWHFTLTMIGLFSILIGLSYLTRP